MLIDSERFAFQPRRHHAFASSGNAYDATQCDEAIQTGDTLIIIADQVVGIAMTWPFAVTRSSGKLHALASPREGETLVDLARSLDVSPADFEHAAQMAQNLGFPLDPQLEKLLAGKPEPG
mgnify:FL=1|jgi:hypothetical protein